jgi:hypothetical protein
MKRSFILCAVLTFFASSLFAAQAAPGVKVPSTPYRSIYFPVAPGEDRQSVNEVNEMLRANPSAEVVSMTSISQTGTTIGLLVVVKLPPGEGIWKKMSKEEFDKVNKAPPEKSGTTP